jgi:hypothetical protein
MLYFFAGGLLAMQWQSLLALLTVSADQIFESAVFVVLVAMFIGLLVKHHRDARVLTSRDAAGATRTECDGHADVGAIYDELVAAVRTWTGLRFRSAEAQGVTTQTIHAPLSNPNIRRAVGHAKAA